MNGTNEYPQDFETADQLLRLIEEAKAAEKSPPADQQLYSRLSWIFDRFERRFPEAVARPEAYEGTIIKLVDIEGQADPKAYNQGPHSVYVIDKQLQRTGNAVTERYAVNRHSYDPAEYRQDELLLDMEFDPLSRRAIGNFSEAALDNVRDILSNPDLMVKAHLDESWLAWKRRQLKARFIGQIAVRHTKIF
jgi:hypothetical protein